MNKLSFLIFFLSFIFFVSCSSSKDVSNIESQNMDETEEIDPNVSLEDRLRKIAGVRVSGSGEDTQVTIRGTSSILQRTEPLFVVDGVAIGNFREARQVVPVAEIESIRVLKSSAQTSVYGSRGASGVIKIELKKK